MRDGASGSDISDDVAGVGEDGDDADVRHVLSGRDAAAEAARGRDGAERGHLQGGDQERSGGGVAHLLGAGLLGGLCLCPAGRPVGRRRLPRLLAQVEDGQRPRRPLGLRGVLREPHGRGQLRQLHAFHHSAAEERDLRARVRGHVHGHGVRFRRRLGVWAEDGRPRQDRAAAGPPAQSAQVQRQDAAARLGQEAEAEETWETGGPVGCLHLQSLRGQVCLQEEAEGFL